MSVDRPFVSRGGLKLDHALAELGVDVAGLACADLGCSTGGFTDCLLKRGAASVAAIDTAYGVLDYTLRIDDRVTVLERTNALHLDPGSPPLGDTRFDLITVDMSWTPQRLCIPAALRWLKEGGSILTLIKPHYEAKGLGMADRLRGGVLEEADADRVLDLVLASLPDLGVVVRGVVKSPVTGSKKGQGNVEHVAWIAPIDRG